MVQKPLVIYASTSSMGQKVYIQSFTVLLRGTVNVHHGKVDMLTMGSGRVALNFISTR